MRLQIEAGIDVSSKHLRAGLTLIHRLRRLYINLCNLWMMKPQKKRAATEVPARVLLNQRFSFLEIVTQCELHDSRISLNAGEVIERRAWTSKLRVESIRDVRITR